MFLTEDETVTTGGLAINRGSNFMNFIDGAKYITNGENTTSPDWPTSRIHFEISLQSIIQLKNAY